MQRPREVTLRLSAPQSTVFLSRVRFRVLVAGRRFGKTYLAVGELIRAASSRPEQICWYIAPTYKQAKRIAWVLLKSFLPLEARLATNETELTITLKNGSIIALIGADQPDSLRGVQVHFAILDEFADMDSYVWSGILRPMLAATGGRALFIGTPKGFNHFYDFYTLALTTPGWERFHYTSMDGHKWDEDSQQFLRIIPDDEIEAVKNDPTVPDRLFKQEYFASFENLAGRVYYAYSRELYPVGNVLKTVDLGGTLCLGMDFNVNPMCSIVGQKVGDQAHVLREIVIQNSNTFEMMQTVRRLYPNREIIAYPDPTGRARKSVSQVVGETDFTIIKKTTGVNIEVYAPSGVYGIQDRLNTTNGMLCNAAGVRRAIIDPSCTHLMKCLDGLTIKEGTNLPDKDLNIDHPGDAFGYWLMGMFPMKKNSLVATELTL